MFLEVRDGVLWQQWSMRNAHNAVKFQWRPVRGQGQQPLGKLILEADDKETKKEWEHSYEKWADLIEEKNAFDPSD